MENLYNEELSLNLSMEISQNMVKLMLNNLLEETKTIKNNDANELPELSDVKKEKEDCYNREMPILTEEHGNLSHTIFNSNINNSISVIKVEPDMKDFEIENDPFDVLVNTYQCSKQPKLIMQLKNSCKNVEVMEITKNILLDHSYSIYSKFSDKYDELFLRQKKAEQQMETDELTSDDEEIDENVLDEWEIKTEELDIKEEDLKQNGTRYDELFRGQKEAPRKTAINEVTNKYEKMNDNFFNAWKIKTEAIYIKETDLEQTETRTRRLGTPSKNFVEEFMKKGFLDQFRLTPKTVKNILEEIPTLGHDCLSPAEQLLLTLNFYSKGSLSRIRGNSFGLCESTLTKIIQRVSFALASLHPRYIKMPQNEEIEEVSRAFYDIAGVPRCIGAIDGTHIRIQSLEGDNAEKFRNEKQFFSFNVQTVADLNLKIRDIVTKWPGSTRDSHIFRNSALCASFENGVFKSSVLVGDNDYPSTPYLIRPLLKVRNEHDALFNESQMRTRKVVERQIDAWKRRFPVLAMGLPLSEESAQVVIVATAVLHNIACEQNEKMPDLSAEQEAAINFVNDVNAPNIDEQNVRLNNK